MIAILDGSVLQDQLNQARAQLSSAQAQLSSAQAQLGSAQAQLSSARSGVQQKQALLSQQRAVLAEAESNLKRYQDLQKEGVVTRQDLESRITAATSARESVTVAQTNISSAQADVVRAQAGVSQAQAGVNQAQAGVQNAITQIQQLETKQAQTSVRAPASGILTKQSPTNSQRVADVGQLTGADPLFYIEQDGSLELQVKVPESLLSQVRIGSPAKITSDADKRINVQGRVREVNPVIDPQTRQATVKIDLPADRLLKPGMFLKSEVVGQRNQALTVPEKAVLAQSDGRKIVYVLDSDDVAHVKSVETGALSQGRVVIKSGLQANQRIVATGAGFVKDGDRVTVVK